MTELIDLVDTHGIPQITVTRSEADHHPHLRMQIVTVVVTHTHNGILTHRRPATANPDPNATDHICGAIRSGETPEQAARREAMEESGAVLTDLRLITAGINAYGRYRWLYVASTNTPERKLSGDGEGATYETIDALRREAARGRKFVKEFFEAIDAVNSPHAIPEREAKGRDRVLGH